MNQQKQRFDIYRLVGDKDLSLIENELTSDSVESFVSVRLSGQFKQFLSKEKVKQMLSKIINITTRETAHRQFFKGIEDNCKEIEQRKDLPHEQSGLLETKLNKIILDLEFSKIANKIQPGETYFVNGRLSKTNHGILLLQAHHVYQLGKPNSQFIETVASFHS